MLRPRHLEICCAPFFSPCASARFWRESVDRVRDLSFGISLCPSFCVEFKRSPAASRCHPALPAAVHRRFYLRAKGSRCGLHRLYRSTSSLWEDTKRKPGQPTKPQPCQVTESVSEREEEKSHLPNCARSNSVIPKPLCVNSVEI